MKLTLRRLDNNTSIMLTAGGEVSETHEMELSSLPVQYTSQPLTKYIHSASTYKIDGAKLYNDGTSISAEYNWLLACTKPLKDTNEPPKLEVIWDDFILDMAYLSGISLTRRMALGGVMTLADLDLTFTLCPVEPKPKMAPVTPKTTSATGVKLSDREQKEYASQVVTKLKSDAKKAASVEFKPNSAVKVDALSNVTVDGRKSGTLKDYGITPKVSTEPPKDTKTTPTTTSPTGVTKK